MNKNVSLSLFDNFPLVGSARLKFHLSPLDKSCGGSGLLVHRLLHAIRE